MSMFRKSLLPAVAGLLCLGLAGTAHAVENGNLRDMSFSLAAVGAIHVVEPTCEAFGRPVVWSHPAYANQTAFVRNDKEVVAVDLAKQE